MTAPKITLYFDIGSPFSYIAFHVLKNSPVFSNCQIAYVPVLLRDLFQKCQNPPPIAVKNKLQWINKERLYWSHRFGVPMSVPIPEGFPASTGNLQAALAGVAAHAPENIVAITEKLFTIFWEEGKTKIIDQEEFQLVFQSEMEENRLSDVFNDQTKAILNRNTESAFNAGAFGLPWFECTNPEGEVEGFWGIDHLGRVADFLRLDKSLDNSFNVLL
ncbi:2-hydroxychromene-2-carboxylate isomerase [Penicillium cosmopolitanum]|uniref:Glutathione S-transferase kappa n=1 Tax=Penicillium cosmopolitanum TaxID=1131564 RepID=A0A9X0BBE6_9EURO|nr:2-hydroxychromene-2-carboxylate isomerase [Penicillium cosmopolitanum]KAJ5403497.1 2-hydroxychromene-2-carboxylate isomerase [Penicillium cosmopolitanum]